MKNQLIHSIRTLRNAIRYHRDQTGDDRCWLDDYVVWSQVDDSPNDITILPEYREAMEQCKNFYQYRRAETADLIPAHAQLNKQHWDSDLDQASPTELHQILQVLQQAIRTHRDIADRVRTVDDDRRLYAVLPEHIPADFRLPSADKFLGAGQARAGCPAFWKSHQDCHCTQHNLHRWGPCQVS